MRAAIGIAVLGLELVLAAGLFAAESLYVPGVALALLGLGAPAWMALTARRSGVTRRLGARRVIEDEPLAVVYELHRRGRGPAPALALADELLPAPRPVRVRRREVTRVHEVVSLPRRGRHVLEAPALVLSEPLGLVRRRVSSAEGNDELLILPRTSPVRAPFSAVAVDVGTALISRSVEAAGEVDGLRPYREGAPAARIHWPALARGAGLVERRVRPEEDTRPLVVLDAREPATEEDLDAAVRAAASLCLALARRGGCALLLPGQRRALALGRDLRAWPDAHARLALVEAAAATASPRLAAARRGPVFYVAARDLHAWPAALAGSARGERILVLPGEAPGRTAAFSVAGCTGLRLTRPRRAAVPA